MLLWLFASTVAVGIVGFVISRELRSNNEELRQLRQDVFRLSVDLTKLQTRLDDLI